jgi:hypothetical protein
MTITVADTFRQLAGNRAVLNAATHVKRAVAHAALVGLGAMFELCSKQIPEMAEEVKDWRDGIRVALGVMPDGPAITVALKRGRFHFIAPRVSSADIAIYFKNLDAALMVFTGQIGSAQAVAERRLAVHGNNHEAMAVTRAMAIVQTYLFPALVTRQTFKRPPELNRTQLIRKAAIMGQLPMAIGRLMLKK